MLGILDQGVGKDVKLPSKQEVYDSLRKLLPDSKGGPNKRAEAAINQMEYYLLHELLKRIVLDLAASAIRHRTVVPNGGLRTFHFNRRRYRLGLRKAILLLITIPKPSAAIQELETLSLNFKKFSGGRA